MDPSHRRLGALGAAAGAILVALASVPLLAQEEASSDSYLGWEGLGRLELRYWGVDGDEAAFRQYHQQNDGFNGGFDPGTFSYKRADGLIFWGNGHVDAPTDMGLHLNLRKEGAGWAKLDLEQADYYYDGQFLGTEGYPTIGGTVPESLRQDPGDLRTNTVNLNIEVGLSLDNFPKVWVGYERKARWGERSTWMASIDEASNGGPAVEFGSQPEFVEADHEFNRFYGGLSWDVGADWNVTLKPQYKLVRGDDAYGLSFFDEGDLVNRQFRKQIYDSSRFQGDLIAKGPLMKDKLALEVGYHFSATWNRNNMESDTAGAALYAERVFRYRDNEHDSNEYMHRFDMEFTWEACEQVTARVGWQYRNGDQDSDAVRNDDGAPNMDEDFGSGDVADTNGPLAPDQILYLDTNNEETGFAESLGLELRCLPKTKIVLEGEFEQLQVDYDWSNTIRYADALAPLVDAGQEGDWAWKDTGNFDRYTVKVHINTRCTDWAQSNFKYKYVFRDADHDEDLDYAEIKDDDPRYSGVTADPTGDNWARFYYPGAVEDTERQTHDAKWQLKLEVTDWLSVGPRAGFTYTSNDVLNQDTDQIAFTQSWLYGMNLTLQPVANLSLTTDAYWMDGFTFTRANRFSRSIGRNPISGGVDAAYAGGVTEPIDFDYANVSQTISYQVDKWTLNLNYTFSRQESWWRAYRHYGSAGAVYEVSERFSIDATFGYEDYSEEQNHGVNDYDAFLGVLGVKAKF